MKKLLERHFEGKLNISGIENYLHGIKSPRIVPEREGENITVSCVQRSISPVHKIELYIDMLNGFVRKAAERKSSLVVFPEYNFFDLFGLFPGFKKVNYYLNKKALSSNSNGTRTRGNLSFLYSILTATAGPIQDAIENIICNLAQKYGINIYSGSYLVKENGCLYNAGSLVSKKGELVGTQKKIHLTGFEESLGLKNGNRLEVFSLDIGKIACPICMDATYFETFKIARKLGADIVVLPIANNEEYKMFKALRGIWPRVQESHVYGLKAALNGMICGLYFSGKSGIFAPINITEKKDGVIALAGNYEGDDLVTGTINLQKLYQARAEAEYHGDINHEFERNYYEQTFQKSQYSLKSQK